MHEMARRRSRHVRCLLAPSPGRSPTKRPPRSSKTPSPASCGLPMRRCTNAPTRCSDAVKTLCADAIAGQPRSRRATVSRPRRTPGPMPRSSASGRSPSRTGWSACCSGRTARASASSRCRRRSPPRTRPPPIRRSCRPRASPCKGSARWNSCCSAPAPRRFPRRAIPIAASMARRSPPISRRLPATSTRPGRRTTASPANGRNPAPGNPLYQSGTEAVTELLEVFVNGLELVRDVRLGGFLGEKAADDKPKQAIYWRSDGTARSLAANMAGMKALFEASGLGDQLSPDIALDRQFHQDSSSAMRSTRPTLPTGRSPTRWPTRRSAVSSPTSAW